MKKISEHKKLALAKLDTLIDNIIANDTSKADKFCYWLEDYSTFLSYENEFSPLKLKRYKRGEIVKAHLGFNIGSEEGGLHYCVVIDKNNALSSPVVTVIPLTSLKPTKNINNLRTGELYISDCFYNKMKEKYDELYKRTTASFLKATNDEAQNSDFFASLNKDLLQLSNIQKELSKLKSGSIALVGQITTISKIRIYDPKNKYDALSNVKLPISVLDDIDNEIAKLFVGKR